PRARPVVRPGRAEKGQGGLGREKAPSWFCGTSGWRCWSLPCGERGETGSNAPEVRFLKKFLGGRCHFPLVVEKKYRLRLSLKAAHHEIRIHQEIPYRVILLAI